MSSKRRISIGIASDLLGNWDSRAKKLKSSECQENIEEQAVEETAVKPGLLSTIKEEESIIKTNRLFTPPLEDQSPFQFQALQDEDQVAGCQLLEKFQDEKSPNVKQSIEKTPQNQKSSNIQQDEQDVNIKLRFSTTRKSNFSEDKAVRVHFNFLDENFPSGAKSTLEKLNTPQSCNQKQQKEEYRTKPENSGLNQFNSNEKKIIDDGNDINEQIFERDNNNQTDVNGKICGQEEHMQVEDSQELLEKQSIDNDLQVDTTIEKEQGIKNSGITDTNLDGQFTQIEEDKNHEKIITDRQQDGSTLQKLCDSSQQIIFSAEKAYNGQHPSPIPQKISTPTNLNLIQAQNASINKPEEISGYLEMENAENQITTPRLNLQQINSPEQNKQLNSRNQSTSNIKAKIQFYENQLQDEKVYSPQEKSIQKNFTGNAEFQDDQQNQENNLNIQNKQQLQQEQQQNIDNNITNIQQTPQNQKIQENFTRITRSKRAKSVEGTSLTPNMRQISIADNQIFSETNKSNNQFFSSKKKLKSVSNLTTPAVQKARSNSHGSNFCKITVSSSPGHFSDFDSKVKSLKSLGLTPVPVKMDRTPVSEVIVQKIQNSGEINNENNLSENKNNNINININSNNNKINKSQVKSQQQQQRRRSSRLSGGSKSGVTHMDMEEDIQRVLQDIGQNKLYGRGSIDKEEQQSKLVPQQVLDSDQDVVMDPVDEIQDDFGSEFRRTSMLDPMYKQQTQLLQKEILELKQKGWEYYQWGQKLNEQLNQRQDIKNQLEAEIQQLNQKIFDMEKFQAEKERSYQQREQHIQQLQESFQKQLNEKQAAVFSLQQEIEDAKHVILTKDMLVKDAHQQLSTIQADKKNIEQQVSQLQNVVKEKDEKLNKYRTLIYEFKEENKKFDDRHQVEKQKIRQLSADIERCKANMVTLQQALKSNGIQPPLLK